MPNDKETNSYSHMNHPLSLSALPPCGCRLARGLRADSLARLLIKRLCYRALLLRKLNNSMLAIKCQPLFWERYYSRCRCVCLFPSRSITRCPWLLQMLTFSFFSQGAVPGGNRFLTRFILIKPTGRNAFGLHAMQSAEPGLSAGILFPGLWPPLSAQRFPASGVTSTLMLSLLICVRMAFSMSAKGKLWVRTGSSVSLPLLSMWTARWNVLGLMNEP